MTSPNFPGGLYPKQYSFTQTIEVPNPTAIKLHFTHFNTEPGKDYVKIVDGGGRRYHAPQISGNSLPRVIVVPHTYVYITFVTHYKSLGRGGWRLEWSNVPMPRDIRRLSCGGDFQLSTGCYKVRHGGYTVTGDYDAGMSWAQAQAMCQYPDGWNLANIESEEENMALATILEQKYSTKKFWIGLGNFGEDTNWTWHTHEKSKAWTMKKLWSFSSLELYRALVTLRTKNATYTAWAPNRPDNQGGDENCAYMYTGKADIHSRQVKPDDYFGKWNDYSCDKNRDGWMSVGLLPYGERDTGEIAALCKAMP